VLLAVDTNVLLHLADGVDDVIDAVETIKERAKGAQLIATPTVLQELFALHEDEEHDAHELANEALTCMMDWGVQPLNLIAVGHGIVEQIGLKLRTNGVLPDQEENDGLIIAEAALLNCQMLLTSDQHMLDAQEHSAFRRLLRETDVDGDLIVIAKPRDIVQKFFTKK
jgi:hypothetical protein